MDASRRPQLPALSYLDMDKVKREEDFYQHRHTNSGASQSLSSSAGASPTYHYPPGPPPPYSHAHGVAPPPTMHTNNWPGSQQAVRTPPAREHDREAAKQNPRQSMPSISEALGVDRQTPFATSQPPPPPPPQSSHTHVSRPPSTAPASPPAAVRRSYPMEPPPPTSYPNGGNTYPQFAQPRQESTQPSPYPSAPGLAPEPHTPARQAPQSGPQPNSSYPHPTESYEPPLPPPPPPPSQSQSTGSMAPPPTVPYGYTPYPPRYANSTPAPPPAPAPPAQSVSSGPIYQPSTVYAPPQSASSGWKAETNARYEDRQSGPAAYGDNVKRHLDFYDLESALNEIASTSGILSDFSRRYGDRMHHTQRSGPALSTLPGIVEVDDMVSKSRVQLDSLLKIRDVILAQQAVYEQQAADQRHHKTFNEPSHQSADASQQESDDGKGGGFAGADSKKRRGRAAPPGRCHSCNRAETPEWRRGPDGARTLCNACGLHYAKLTRKNQGTNKGGAIGGGGGSNLRPKENIGQ